MYFDVQTSEKVDAGVTEEEMLAADVKLAGYLSGDGAALDGALFGERAAEHMKDVLYLFNLARDVRNISLIAGILLLASAMNADRARRLCVGSRIALIALALPLAAFGLWAAFDFESAFEGMHRLLFTNDLYLLDPDTELLIRLLPERFFVEVGRRLALRCGLAALAVPLVFSVFDAKVNLIGKIFGKSRA